MTTTAVAHRRTVTRFAADLAERLGATFAEAFLGVIAVAFTSGKVDLASPDALVTAAAAAGIAAVVALVKGMIAARVGRQGTAALLPLDLDHRDVIDVEHAEHTDLRLTYATHGELAAELLRRMPGTKTLEVGGLVITRAGIDPPAAAPSSSPAKAPARARAPRPGDGKAGPANRSKKKAPPAR